MTQTIRQRGGKVFELAWKILMDEKNFHRPTQGSTADHNTH